jgi:hypothetical protein
MDPGMHGNVPSAGTTVPGTGSGPHPTTTEQERAKPYSRQVNAGWRDRVIPLASL